MFGAVEADAELSSAMARFASTAGSGDASLPIGGFRVESAKGLARLRDRDPRLRRAGKIGDAAARGDRDFTQIGRLAFSHPETAGLFGSGGEFVHWLAEGRIRDRGRYE